MNIDDLKGAWKDNDASFAHSEWSLALQRKTSSAIARVRGNMKTEFISTLLSYVIMLWFLFSRQKTPLFFNVTCIALTALMLLNLIYYFRFYAFYKAMSRYDASVKQSIGKVVYELELNTELYETYNICILPLTVMVVLGIIWNGQTSGGIYNLLTGNLSTVRMLMVILVMAISFIAAYNFIQLHTKRKYQKYLLELKDIASQVNENKSG